MAEAAKQQELPEDFEAAFSQFSYPGDEESESDSDFKPVNEDDEPVQTAETEVDPEPEEEGAESETAADDAVEEEETEEAESEAEASDEGDADEEAAEKQDNPPQSTENKDEDLLERFTKLVEQSQKGKKEEPEPQKAQEQEEQEPDLYTEEEKQLLQEYEKEWPEVSKAETLRRRGEYRELVGYIFEQIASEIRPMMEQVQAVAERVHYGDLQETVEDYDDIRDDVVAWVDDQPEYLQDAYKRVITQGTVDEVADLISRFKQETGRNQPAPEPARKKEAELPKTAKKAAESLAPVSSKRTAPPEPDDPNDFESAFSKFADQLK